MTKVIKSKKEGFVLEITQDVAHALGVDKPDDLCVIVMGDEVILKAKKDGSKHKKKQQEESDQLTRRLIQQYTPVLKKLAKT